MRRSTREMGMTSAGRAEQVRMVYEVMDDQGGGQSGVDGEREEYYLTLHEVGRGAE